MQARLSAGWIAQAELQLIHKIAGPYDPKEPAGAAAKGLIAEPGT
jgi:hypothetical protein